VDKGSEKSSKILLSSSSRRLISILTLMVMDTLALLIGLVLAGYLVGGKSRVGEVVYFAPVLLAVWVAIFAAHDLYARAQSRREPGALLGATLLGAGLLVFGSVIYPQSGFSLEEILLGLFFIILLSAGLRLLYEQGTKRLYRRRSDLIPTLIIGEEEERARMRQMMEKSPSAYTCVGELNMNGQAIELPLLRQMLERTGARNVVLAGAERLSDAQFLDLLRSMWLRRVQVKVVPGAPALMSSNPAIAYDMGVPLLEVSYPRLNSAQWALKRMLDVTGSLGGLIVLSPLLIGVAILIKLTSPGPIFFKQKRVGADERIFCFYKFRSMYKDAEQLQAELEEQNEAGGAIFKIKDDPRATPVGRFIRRWSIDELPQLINVLKGEMSLVGPRPLPIRDFERMDELHKKRLGTIPGITGYWQISGRSKLSFEDMVRLDLYYIENWSLSLDVKIILKTLGAVLRGDGAY
jgi:exopolysaccharide biosynthesis polyprenyl glycosylphosphotransferase